MAGICFYFEPNDVDVWSGRPVDLDAWNYAAKAAGDIDQFVVVNRTAAPLRSIDADQPFREVVEVPDLPGRIAHVCCPWDSAVNMVSLWEFDHQVDWYVFGPAEGWRNKMPALGVYAPQAGEAALHAVHVASVVMLHRFAIRGQS